MSYMNQTGKMPTLTQEYNPDEVRPSNDTNMNTASIWASRANSNENILGENGLARPAPIQGVEIVLKTMPSHMSLGVKQPAEQMMNHPHHPSNASGSADQEATFAPVPVTRGSNHRLVKSRQGAASQVSSSSLTGDKGLKSLLNFVKPQSSFGEVFMKPEPNLNVHKIQNDLIGKKGVTADRSASQLMQSQKQLTKADTSHELIQISDSAKLNASAAHLGQYRVEQFRDETGDDAASPYLLGSEQSSAFDYSAPSRTRKI